MKQFIYYNPMTVTQEAHRNLPGIAEFAHYFTLYNKKVFPVDRTGTLQLPIRTASLFPMPAFRHFTKTFEEICNERAQELLKHADNLNVPIRVFYSGGVDSTLVLVSFLKNATPAQKENIMVLLTEESISENPRFYKEHIHGKFKTDSSMMFPNFIGQNHLIVNGEHNDQLNGSDMVGGLITKFGPSVIHQPYSRDLFFTFFNGKLNDERMTNHYLNLFEKLKKAAPVDIATNYDFLWWINFSLKWQTVSLRMIPYVTKRNVAKVTTHYFNTNFAPFYRTDDFQLWSMNNPEKKIKDGWHTYKWTCKDIIYDYTKDADYRDNKAKRGSLYNILLQLKSYDFIDESFTFTDTEDVNDYYNPDNDFKL